MWICMHCLEESSPPEGWEADACPSCIEEGHTDGWAPRDGACTVCDGEFYRKMDEIVAGMNERIRREHPEAGR